MGFSIPQSARTKNPQVSYRFPGASADPASVQHSAPPRADDVLSTWRRGLCEDMATAQWLDAQCRHTATAHIQFLYGFCS